MYIFCCHRISRVVDLQLSTDALEFCERDWRIQTESSLQYAYYKLEIVCGDSPNDSIYAKQ